MLRTHLTLANIKAASFRRVALLAALPVMLAVPASAIAQDMKSATEERMKHAAVMVFTAKSEREKGDTPLGSGSGYFINSTGLLVTNNHVIDPTHGMVFERERQAWYYSNGTLTFTVVTDSGTDSEQSYECTKLYQNRTADQALLQARNKDGTLLSTPNYMRLLPESRLRADMKAWAFGFPGGDSQRASGAGEKHPAVTITQGTVLQVPRTPGGRIRQIFTDVVANRGNSGGAMVDIDGFVLGAVTLKSKPEDREDTGGANYSALSPSQITREMLANAYMLKKIPDGTDFTPFIDLLTNDEGRIDIPEFRREKAKDVLFFPSGDRLHGTISTDKIRWESPIGNLEVPTEVIAYVMKSDGGASLFLEGGNRIAANQADQKFKFKPDNGDEAEFSMENVKVLGLKTADRKIAPTDGKVYVFDSDLSHLVLSEVTGKVKFEGTSATVVVSFDDIYRVEQSPSGDGQILIKTDGQRLTGKFQEEPFVGKIAATGTAISFSLSKVAQATVELRRMRGDAIMGLDLVGVMAAADAEKDVLRTARLIEYGDVKMARVRLTEMGGADQLKTVSAIKKEQISLLEGVCSIREGQYEQAKKALRGSTKSSSINIAAYALASSEVLKKFGTEYKSKPLSDRANFISAGTSLADELVAKVRNEIKNMRRLPFEKRGDFATVMNNVRKYEDDMSPAAVFIGTDAEDEMLRLWKLATDSVEKEVARLEKAIQDLEQQGTGPNARRDNPVKRQRDIQALQAEREAAIESFRKFIEKQFEYGFRIEDPDIHALKVKKSSGGKIREEDEDESP